MKALVSALEKEAVSPELVRLIATIVAITRTIAEQVRYGALGETLGATVTENVQGEVQKKLDVIANNLLIDALVAQGSVRAIASEEEAHTIEGVQGAPYLVAFDPLDGSSNIDINAQIGTIFTIFNARDDVPAASDAQFFQQGTQQCCAGYVLYGPYTTLMLTMGKVVHEFTLNPQSGEFVRSHSPVNLPAGKREFAVNMANFYYWPQTFQHYILTLIAPKPDSERFNMRWQGAMVGDVHRVLTRGGIFMYPCDCRNPDQPARLRLLYEAFPMGLLIEAAGGRAYSESERTLTRQLTHLHQRVPVTLGDKTFVEAYLLSFSKALA